MLLKFPTPDQVSIGVSVMGVVIALAAAWFARRSSAAAAESARSAARQVQLSYVESISRSQPPMTMVLDAVECRWSTNGFLWDDIGGATDPGLPADAKLTQEAAAERDLHVEVVVRGRLVNTTTEEVLLTKIPGRTRQPHQNQDVVLVDGHHTVKTVIPGAGSVDFTWVDRRPFAEWEALALALDNAGPQAGRNSGFEMVAHGRMDERISYIWTAELGRSAIAPFAQEELTNAMRWRLAESTDGPIDDEVIRYRCRLDATLAQVDPPQYRTVLGRL